MPDPAPNSAATRGALSAFAGYALWGLLPVYWKQLAAVDAWELLAHRVVWTVLLLAGVLSLRHRGQPWWRAWRDGRTLRLEALSGALLGLNWLIFVWAVNHGFVIECSLGYFLVPLLSAALGRTFLGERLRRAQQLALALAAVGVVLMASHVGKVPWIALGLAGTFGIYGLLRKKSPLGPLTGLAMETSLLAPLALAWLVWQHLHGTGAFSRQDLNLTLGVLSTGIITPIPLLLFAYGARRLRLTTLGLLQYTAPTLQFLVGWRIYQEPFSAAQALAFAFIWSGLACYSFDAWREGRRARRVDSTLSPT